MRAFASTVTSLALLLLASGAGGALQGCGGSSGDASAQPPAAVPPAAEMPAPTRGDVHVTFAQGDASVARVQWGEAFVVRIDG